MQGFNDFLFDESMRTARDRDGGEIVFTRQERAILVELARRPGTLIGRRDLHRALAETGRVASERNVDFLVNRLRARLGDDARAPRYIATQYGEGYIWIAQSVPVPPSQARGFVIIGSTHGGGDIAACLLSALQADLKSLVGPGRGIVQVPELRPDALEGTDYGLEVSFHTEDDRLHGAFVMRSIRDRRVIATRRATATGDNQQQIASELAGWVRDTIWRHLAMPHGSALLTPGDLPAEIRLNEAARALARSPERWRETEAQLKRARAQSPGDPVLAVMWAMNLFARLIHWPLDPAVVTRSGRAALENEIEALVLDHLPVIDDNALLKLAAAKLLFFIDRGHFELADRLAEEAFAESTAFGAAFATRGQMLMCKGEFEEACRLYDKGIALSEFGTDFHIYQLVLKCTALMAADDRSGVARTADEMYLARPATRWMGLFFLSPYEETVPDAVAAMLAGFTPARGRETLTHLYHTSARQFRRRSHAANVMRGPAHHFRRLLGPEAIPADIAGLLGRPLPQAAEVIG
jgi:DNA-binding winged helix-turn-helix (wHTH) protein/tetratricopeptide (TPR) repeat protein